MSNNYPDVNKNWINDNNLCWAAASNALAYTHWNRLFGEPSSEEIFTIFKTESEPGRQNQGWRAHLAIGWLLKDYYHLRVPVTEVVQDRSPFDLCLMKYNPPLLRAGGCGIFDIGWDDKHRSGHDITFYDISVISVTPDPRAVRSALCVDSDDNSTQTFNLDLEYDISSRLYKVTLGNRDGFIFGWTAVQPYPVV